LVPPFVWQIQTSHAAAWLVRAPVHSLVELLLRKRRQQQPQALKLFRVQNPAEQLIEVFDRNQLALRHIAQVRPGRQIHRRRKLRQKTVGNVEVQIEACKVALLLLIQLVDLRLREHHAALRVIGVRQRKKSLREDSPFADHVGVHIIQLRPGHPRRQLHPHALLHGLGTVHHHTPRRTITQVVAFIQKVHLPFHDPRFRGNHATMNRCKRLRIDHRHVTVGNLRRRLSRRPRSLS
jgi:hypothetical protein